jgi:hypothetical protein
MSRKFFVVIFSLVVQDDILYKEYIMVFYTSSILWYFIKIVCTNRYKIVWLQRLSVAYLGKHYDETAKYRWLEWAGWGEWLFMNNNDKQTTFALRD